MREYHFEFFFNEIPKPSFWKEQSIVPILENLCNKEQLPKGNVSYVFGSDEWLLEINQKFLNHDTYTDIITFDQSDSEDELDGEIYISLDRVRENAQKFEVTFEKELHRVMVHGLLHLAGFSDKTEEEKKLMREKEEEYINIGSR